MLEFYFFPKSNTPSVFPDFGISYGVFGRFGSQQGYIYTDDEDSDGNCYKGNFNYLSTGGYDISKCIEGGANTRLYMSRVIKSNDCTYP